MTEQDYIKAFRFGFGVNHNKPFDPAQELAAPPQEDAQLAPLISKRITDVESQRQAFVDSGKSEEQKKKLREIYRASSVGDLHQAIVRAATGDQMFINRISAFWANHFSLGKSRPILKVIEGQYENSLRPFMFGRFSDLLLAAELHPAMVIFLNLEQSIGPNSPAGQRSGKGLNENLGREILELHTLGVNGGYGQADVVALSNLLTGWFIPPQQGEVTFKPRRAEPGPKMLLGKSYGGAKPREEDAKLALTALARHPSTARFISSKLATHFFGAQSTGAAKTLEDVFTSSNGNLTAIYRAMLDLKDASAPLTTQSRNDFQFLVSALRAAPLRPNVFDPQTKPDGTPKPNQLTVGNMHALTQQLWLATSPKGWPDDQAYWLSASVISTRLKRIPVIVHGYQDIAPMAFAEAALGPLMSDNTRSTLKLASNRFQSIGLALASPEFNRR